MAMPLFLSPALPSELLTYILHHHTHPTTLIICSSRADFLSSVTDDIRHQTAENANAPAQDEPDLNDNTHTSQKPHPKHPLLSSPLYQVATSRHIRVVYIPTVTHLRAYLSIFPDSAKVPAPPPSSTARKKPPHIFIYGFLDLHHDTSEWSAQGLGNTASAFVDLAHRLSWQAVIIEPRTRSSATRLEDVLREAVPILSGGTRRMGPGLEQGTWAGRTVEVGKVLKRWFCFQRGYWDDSSNQALDQEEP
ncbi:hypothetical protein F5Y15DRAFT_393398 [Xylariaceae sp. FL0016]|nr:hypothetical protein F5Y15DRAFT_393398 [Xylariaceae sp. FL0016]